MNTNSASAKSHILGRIRAANHGATSLTEAAQQWQTIPRTYSRGSMQSRLEVLAMLADRLRDYDAQVASVTSESLPAALQAAIESGGALRMLVASGFPADWLPREVEFTYDESFTAAELDRFDGVVTSATLGIAETGSIVLQAVPGQGRRATTLLPDFHFCTVRVEDVVQTVPEAVLILAARATLPTTFVSGPSATADIEMTRIKGVHGPRFLYVFLVHPPQPTIRP